MKKLGIKSDVVVEKGDSASIMFEAKARDTYFCCIPGHREAGMEGQFEIIKASTGSEITEEVVPEKNGEPLNFYFEDATPENWTATGKAFKGQPTSDKTTGMYEEGMSVNSKGQFFITSGGSRQAQYTDILISTSFEVSIHLQLLMAILIE